MARPPDGDGRLGRQVTERFGETVLGERLRMDALSETGEVVRGSVELLDELADVGARPTLATGRDRRQLARDVGQRLLGADPQLLAQSPTLLVTSLDEASARGHDVAHAGSVLGLETHIGENQPHGGADRVRQRAVAQRGGVVDQRRHGRPAVLHERDDPLLGLLRERQPHRLAGLVHPLLVHPVGDHEGGVAHGPRQQVPEGPGLLTVGEVNHETGRGCTHRAARDEGTARAPAVRTIAAS